MVEERERERGKEREREKEGGRERETDRQTERQTDRERDRQRTYDFFLALATFMVNFNIKCTNQTLLNSAFSRL